MRTCAHCNKELLDNRANKYCNQACYMSTKVIAFRIRNCVVCGAKCEMAENKRARNRNVYCSLPCRTKAWTGSGNPRWRSGYLDSDGYKRQSMSGGKSRPDHLLIAEKALGRPLLRGEVVHHINGIKTDNRNSNLLICTQAYHMWLHAEMGRRYQQEHFI